VSELGLKATRVWEREKGIQVEGSLGAQVQG
jgi:hypothetical protein